MEHSRQIANFRGVFPGAFTMGNMLCGFLSILSAYNQEPATAGWLIILAAFLDALDGKVARLARGSSRFGLELDSLADVVSFGAAPAFLLHTLKIYHFGRWGFMIGAVFLMCGAFRLARYNVISDPHRKENAVGLPIPIAGIAISSYVILCMEYFDQIRFPEFLTAMVIACSGLMVSQVPYYALPERFESRENRWKLFVIFVFLVAVLIKPRMMIFPFVALYILSGVVREGYRVMLAGHRAVRARGHARE